MSGNTITMVTDLDGTLAEYHSGQGIDTIGPPVPNMVARVKDWLFLGYRVVVYTARVGPQGVGVHIPDQLGSLVNQLTMIHSWLIEHIGQDLPVTATKDYTWTEIWDDRAVRVEKNTGRSELHDAHLILSAAGVGPGALLERLQALVDVRVSDAEAAGMATQRLRDVFNYDRDHPGEYQVTAQEFSVGTVVIDHEYDRAAFPLYLKISDARALAAQLLRAAEDAE